MRFRLFPRYLIGDAVPDDSRRFGQNPSAATESQFQALRASSDRTLACQLPGTHLELPEHPAFLVCAAQIMEAKSSHAHLEALRFALSAHVLPCSTGVFPVKPEDLALFYNKDTSKNSAT